MSNKEFYKRLGIEKGDSLTLMQIIQIAQMRSQEGAEIDEADKPIASSLNTDNAVYEDITDTDIVDAVYSLDPDNDRHWTQTGQPAMNAIETRIGTSRVNRRDIDRVLPGYNRTSAKG